MLSFSFFAFILGIFIAFFYILVKMTDALNDFEPSRKKFRLVDEEHEHEEETRDFVSILPPTIVSKIFLFLDNFDIFRTCALVCKRWNCHVNSDSFWQSLIAFEFGKDAEARFISSCQGDTALMVNKMREILSFDREITYRTFGCLTRREMEPKHGLFPWGNEVKYSSLDEFLYRMEKNVKSKEVYNKGGFRLVNLAKIVPHPEIVLDILRLRFAIRGAFQSSRPYHLIDSKFDLIQTHNRKYPVDLWSTFILPKSFSFSYLITQDPQFRLRLLLPSCGTRITRLKKSDTSKLIDLARSGDVSKIAEFLSQRHPDIEGLGKARPLVGAARNGHTMAVQVLLKAGAKLDRPDNEGFTPLGAAAATGRTELCRFLLSSGAKIDNNEGIPALLLAIMNAKAATIKLLMDRGADARAKDLKGKNALQCLAEHFRQSYLVEGFQKLKDPKKMEAFVSAYDKNRLMLLDWLVQGGCDINAISEDDKNMTHLMIACEKLDVQLAKWLIDRGADVRVKNSRGRNALHYLTNKSSGNDLAFLEIDSKLKASLVFAHEKDFLAVLDGLVKGGCDINAISSDRFEKMTPLMMACKKRDLKLAELLIHCGADVNVVLEHEEIPTALFAVIRSFHGNYNRTKLIKLLLSKGAAATLEVRDHVTYEVDGCCCETVLESVFHDVEFDQGEYDHDLFKLLVEHGANVNVKRETYNITDRRSLLTRSLTAGLKEAAKLFICAGADVNLPGRRCVTPLMQAARLLDLEIVDLLMEHGANVNARDNQGRTALMYAVEASLSKKRDKENNFGQDWQIDKKRSKKPSILKAPVVETLLRHGADMSLKDNSGRMALDFIEQSVTM